MPPTSPGVSWHGHWAASWASLMLARENLPSCSLSLFLFFRQDLGAETMGLMLFFFPCKQFLLIWELWGWIPTSASFRPAEEVRTRQQGAPGSVR